MSRITGGCPCGEIKYSIDESAMPIFVVDCHCVTCKEHHATANGVLDAAVPQDAFQWESDSAEKVGQYKYRLFCKTCGTKVANDLREMMGAMTVFPVLFDSVRETKKLPEKYAVSLHLNCESSLIRPNDSLHCYRNFPIQFGGDDDSEYDFGHM